MSVKRVAPTTIGWIKMFACIILLALLAVVVDGVMRLFSSQHRKALREGWYEHG